MNLIPDNNIPQERKTSIDSTKYFSLGDALYILRRNWYWYLIALAVIGGVTFLYLSSTPKIYQRNAALLLKSKSNNTTAMLSDVLLQSGMPITTDLTNEVENQIQILRARQTVETAIDRRGLDVEYLEKKGLRIHNLYRSSPIFASFIDSNPMEQLGFHASISDDGLLHLSNFDSSNENLQKQTINISVFPDTVFTPLGRIVIQKAPAYDSFKGKEIRVEKKNRELIVDDYLSNYTVSHVEKSSTVIKLTALHSNPLIAHDFLDAIISTYLESLRVEKLQVADKTEAFIDERLAIISQDLGHVDDRIQRFKQANSIADISTETKTIVEGNSDLSIRISQVNNQLAIAEYIKQLLGNSSGNQYDLMPANLGITDATSVSFINEYNQLVLKRDQLLKSSSSKNPVVETIDNQLAATRRAVLKSLDNHIEALNIVRGTLEKEQGQTMGRISSVPMQEKVVGSIYRDQKIKEELYLYLLNARERNALSREAIESDVKIIQSPTGKNNPIAPRIPFVLLGSFILILLLPTVFLYLRFILNNKVRGVKDLDKYTTIPRIGEIPHYHSSRGRNKIHGADSKKLASLLEGKKAPLISEAFSVIRTNLMYMAHEGVPPKVIMMSSAVASSGKTFVSANLAHSLAMLKGKKLLLIDADLRKGSLTSTIKLLYRPQSKGLSAYLSNTDISISDIITTVGKEGEKFDFISSGAFPPNPAELLLSERFHKFMAKVRQEYDYVLIDSVPFLNLPDAFIIGRNVDMSIVVVREGVLPRVLLGEIERAYLEKSMPHMTVLLNDAGRDLSTHGYLYSTYGSYGYGYGYGYGYNTEDNKD